MLYIHNPLPYTSTYFQDDANIGSIYPNSSTNTPESAVFVELANVGGGTNEVENFDAMIALFNACTGASRGFTRIVLGGAGPYLLWGTGGSVYPAQTNQLAQFVLNAHLRGLMVTFAIDIDPNGVGNFPLNYRKQLVSGNGTTGPFIKALRRYQNMRQSFGTADAVVNPDSLLGTEIHSDCASWAGPNMNIGCVGSAAGSLLTGLPVSSATTFTPPGSSTTYKPITDGNYSAKFDDVLIRAPFWLKAGYNAAADDAARVPDICGFLDAVRAYLNMRVGFEVLAGLSANPSITINGIGGAMNVHLVRHADFLHVQASVAHDNQASMLALFQPWVNALKGTVGTGLPANPLPINIPLWFEYGTSTIDAPITKAKCWTSMETMSPTISGWTTAHGFTGFSVVNYGIWKTLP